MHSVSLCFNKGKYLKLKFYICDFDIALHSGVIMDIIK